MDTRNDVPFRVIASALQLLFSYIVYFQKVTP